MEPTRPPADLSRRNFVAGAAGLLVPATVLGRVASLPAKPPGPYITLERNRPKQRGFLPLNTVPEHTRAEIFRRRVWLEQREEQRARLQWGAINNEPGAAYKYFRFTWTHCNPYYEWPEWWAEQDERLTWAHRRYGIEYKSWQRRGPPIDPEVARNLHREGLLGATIVVSAPPTNGTTDPGSGPVMGAFYLGGAGASDSNDGMLVSEGGTGPWATFGKLQTEWARSFEVGDQIYLRAGTWVPTTYGALSGGGTAANANKITIEGYPGETAIISFTDTGNDDNVIRVSEPDGEGPFRMASANWRFKCLTLRNEISCWSSNIATPARGCEFINIQREWLGNKNARDNSGSIMMRNASTDLLIEAWQTVDGCHQVGTNSNASELYYIEIPTGVIIRNSLIKWAGSGSCIHHKRTNNASDHTYENNFLYHYGNRACIKAVNLANATFAHNVFASANGSNAVWFSDGGSTDADGRACTFDHNMSGRLNAGSGAFCQMGVNCQYHSRLGTEGEDGIVKNNIFQDEIRAMFSGSNSAPNYTHNLTCDYNHFNRAAAGSRVARYYNSDTSRYTANLAAWVAETTGFSGGAHDRNSIVNVQTYGAKSLTDPTSWECTNTGSGDDATPMGPDFSLVGPGALGY